MSAIFFQYGTAAHLALLTVAPLFLSATCGVLTQTLVLVWLSLFGLLWVLMNPSPRRDEWPRDARRRIGFELARDPFTFFCIVALLLSAVCAANGGVDLSYDSSTGLWRLTPPALILLPGSVTGHGILPLAGLFGLSVVVLGTRHALNRHARFWYLFLTTFLAAAAAVYWLYVTRQGVAVAHLAFSPEDPYSLGTLLGPFFLFGVVAWVESWFFAFKGLEFIAALPVAVLLAGLLLTASTFVLVTFVLLGLVALGVGTGLAIRYRSRMAWLRTALALAIVLAPVAFLVTDGAARRALWPIFPQGFAALRAAATSVAFEAWKDAVQLGRGLGAYPLALGFYATPEDWRVLTMSQTAAPNGWIQLLFERGILGALVYLVGFLILLRDGILRFLRAGSHWSLTSMHLLGLFVLAGVSAVLFVECGFIRPDALMPLGAALALTAAAFPESSESDHG